VFVLGDSHLKHCVLELRNDLSSKLQVIGVIKPASIAENIANTSLNVIQNFGAHDAVILNAGSNDVDKKNLVAALTEIITHVQTSYGTNIIILDLPYGHDIQSPSLVNTRIKEFNRKLKKIIAPYNHVSLIETNLRRDFSTRHGLHWNKLGKALVVKLVCCA
jgi:hypothetical protein